MLRCAVNLTLTNHGAGLSWRHDEHCARQPRQQRLDLLLVELGLAESREKARALIMAGSVLVNDEPATKPGQASAGWQRHAG